MPFVTGKYLKRRLESADGFVCAIDNCTVNKINSNKYIRTSFKSIFCKKQIKLTIIVYDPGNHVYAANKKPSVMEGSNKISQM